MIPALPVTESRTHTPLSIIQGEIDKMKSREPKLVADYHGDRIASSTFHHFLGTLAGLHAAKRALFKAQKRGDIAL